MATNETAKYWQRKANAIRSQHELCGRIAMNDAIIAIEELMIYLDKNGLEYGSTVEDVKDRLKLHMDKMDEVCGG